MKNNFWLKALLVVVGFVAVVFMSLFFESKNSALTEEVQAWADMTKTDEYVTTVIAQSWCSHCEAIKPIIEKIQEKYGILVYWFDVDTMSEADRNEITTVYPTTYNGTPHIFITKSGKLVSEYPGEGTEKEYVKWLTENGVISEK